MELYTLDSLFRRNQVVDDFESLIWTERFSSMGDFEMHIRSTPGTRQLLQTDTRVAVNTSMRVGTIETVEDGTDADGKSILTVTGRSLESILTDRVAKDTMGSLTTDPKWVITGLPAAIARRIFNETCVTSLLAPGDAIPFYTPGNIMPTDTNPEPTQSVTIEIEPSSVYDAIKQICDLYDLGFRLIRNFDASQLYFNIYAGSNRTTQQSVLPPVVFSPSLDNLQNTTSLRSSAANKTVAYVFSPVGSTVVYAEGIDPEVEGFERRVLMVKADDITDPVPANATALMVQRGKDELSKNKSFAAFDGELSKNSNYKYGIDYNLGDMVEQRSIDNAVSLMRVTEQIFVSDGEGERAYPTLQVKLFLQPGTWQDWKYRRKWVEMGLTEYWGNA